MIARCCNENERAPQSGLKRRNTGWKTRKTSARVATVAFSAIGASALRDPLASASGCSRSICRTGSSDERPTTHRSSRLQECSFQCGDGHLHYQTPPFSPRRGTTRDTVIDWALELRIAAAAAEVEIFPDSDEAPAKFAALSEPAAEDASPGGYWQIRRKTAAPLRRFDAAIKEIPAGISRFYDAFG